MSTHRHSWVGGAAQSNPAGRVNRMKRPLQIILAALVVVFGLLTVRGRQRARAEAELWAEATDQL